MKKFGQILNIGSTLGEEIVFKEEFDRPPLHPNPVDLPLSFTARKLEKGANVSRLETVYSITDSCLL